MDRQLSALGQVERLAAEYPPAAWSEALNAPPAPAGPAQDLATLLLAVNFELLGYPPEQAWMFAQRDLAAPGRLDG